MRVVSSLVFVACFVFLTTCSQSGVGGSGRVNPAGTTGGSNTGGTGRFLTLSAVGPNVPNVDSNRHYYVTWFADSATESLQQNYLAQGSEVPITGLNRDGMNYCFSNQEYSDPSRIPKCTEPSASSPVIEEIKGLSRDTSAVRIPVFISALQFSFSNRPHDTTKSDDIFSEAIVEGASVEKAPISFDRNTGALKPVSDGDITVLNYGTGCNLQADQWAVGFTNPSSYLGKEYFLTGVHLFERTRRKAFGETTAGGYRDPIVCQDPLGKQSFCNLIASKATAIYAAILPVRFIGDKIGSRQFPNQIADGTGIHGDTGSQQTSFGLYAGSTSSANFVTTRALGKEDGNGNLVPGWERTFIRKFCIRGKRRERDVDGQIRERPLIMSFRAELRYPSMVWTQ